VVTWRDAMTNGRAVFSNEAPTVDRRDGRCVAGLCRGGWRIKSTDLERSRSPGGAPL